MFKRFGIFLCTAIIGAFVLACENAPTDPMADSTGGLDIAQGQPAGTEYNPFHESQTASCDLVDRAIAKLPKTDGDGTVTDDEVGPGGWRHQSSGQGFVTFNYVWDDASEYTVIAGRSNVGTANVVPSDYPEHLDLPQDPREGQRTFEENTGTIVLTGGPGFELPGPDDGQVILNLNFVETDGADRIYEGCATIQFQGLFGFLSNEGGDFRLQSYFKAWASTDGDFNVTEYEWTEIDTYKNVDPSSN